MAFASFTLPSLHDGLLLDGRVHHPQQIQTDDTHQLRGAVAAHPYAPLGGSFDDHVVEIVTEELLRQGFIVVTFNFRGAAGSAGRTSWTGRPELDDYKSMVAFLYFLLLSTSADQEQATPGVSIVLGGYSYGSMMAMRSPAAQDIVTSSTSALLEERMKRIEGVARTLHNRQRKRLGTGGGSITATAGSSTHPVSVTSSWLLISPLLPPISNMLSMASVFRGSAYSMEEISRKLEANRALIVYGTQDMFTSGKKVRAWAEGLYSRSDGKIEHLGVEDADHFWRNKDHRVSLVSRIKDWIEGWTETGHLGQGQHEG